MASGTRIPKAELTSIYGAVATRMARKLFGEVPEVPRWRESDVFTPLERDVMEYAEAMTLLEPLAVASAA